MKIFKMVFAVALAALTTASAHAEIVTFEFTAVVSKIFQLDPTLPFMTDSVVIKDSTVRTSDIVHGTFSYDTSAPVWLTPRPDTAVYKDLASLTFAFQGGLKFEPATTPGSSQVSVQNNRNYAGDTRFLDSIGIATGVLENESASFFLVDDQGIAFNSTSLPSRLTLSQFSQRTLTYDIGPDDTRVSVEAEITSLNAVTAVPEPSSYVLLLSGLALLGWRRRAARA
jgi:hypothetical protein